jgi:hypothetical protein
MKKKVYIDSIIVPVSRTINEIKSTSIYLQQINRPFKQKVDYLIFYANKKIVGYGKILKIDELITHREYYIEKFIEIDIPHLERGSFIIGRKYTSLKTVLNAKTTKEI